jgi:tRNA threonylcarbamoyl adenosine modification protein YeaZ
LIRLVNVSVKQDFKPILGIETAFGAVSVCVIGSLDFEPIALMELDLDRGHAEALVPVIKGVVRSTGLNFTDLGRVAVSIGPGSFTGVRIGLSAARAIGLAIGVDVIGVSTLSAFAAPFLGGEAPVLASVVEARNQQVYFQSFDCSGTTLVGPSIGMVTDMLSKLGSRPLALVGNAASRVGHEAVLFGTVVSSVNQKSSPSVMDIARLGCLSPNMRSPPRPSYFV